MNAALGAWGFVGGGHAGAGVGPPAPAVPSVPWEGMGKLFHSAHWVHSPLLDPPGIRRGQGREGRDSKGSWRAGGSFKAGGSEGELGLLTNDPVGTLELGLHCEVCPGVHVAGL